MTSADQRAPDQERVDEGRPALPGRADVVGRGGFREELALRPQRLDLPTLGPEHRLDHLELGLEPGDLLGLVRVLREILGRRVGAERIAARQGQAGAGLLLHPDRPGHQAAHEIGAA